MEQRGGEYMSPVIISYTVNGRMSRYYLSSKYDPNDNTVIELKEGEKFQ